MHAQITCPVCGHHNFLLNGATCRHCGHNVAGAPAAQNMSVPTEPVLTAPLCSSGPVYAANPGTRLGRTVRAGIYVSEDNLINQVLSTVVDDIVIDAIDSNIGVSDSTGYAEPVYAEPAYAEPSADTSSCSAGDTYSSDSSSSDYCSPDYSSSDSSDSFSGGDSGGGGASGDF